MDQEAIQKAYEVIQKFMKQIVETVTQVWNAF